MSRAVIVLNGAISDYNLIKSHINDDDFIVCADGALYHLEQLGIKPDVWIGDSDSCVVDDSRFESLLADCEIVRLNPIKDMTDGEEACEYVCSSGFSRALIIGFSGTRFDHTLCNIFMLKKFHDAGINASAISENNIVFFAESHNEVKYCEYRYVSIIPISNCITGVTNKGFYYPLNNDSLLRYSSRGISNELIENIGTIDIESGDALIILSKD